MKKQFRAIVVLALLMASFSMLGIHVAFAEGNNYSLQQTTNSIRVEEVKVVSAAEWWHEEDLRIIDFKFTCLYPKQDNEIYPELFNINFAFLDDEGVIVKKCTLQMSNLMYGDKVWASSNSSYHAKEKLFHAGEYNAVKFTGYDVMWISGRPDLKQYTFEDPPIFSLEEGEADLDRQEGAAPIPRSVGETIQTDSVEITLNEFAFQEAVDIGSNISLAASGNDMILACLSLTVKNTDKKPLTPREIMDVTVDYNDGYTYSTSDKLCYLLTKRNDPDVCTFVFGKSANGADFALSPLASGEYILAIPCTDVVENDETSPLKLVFALPNEGVAERYEYKIR